MNALEYTSIHFARESGHNDGCLCPWQQRPHSFQTASWDVEVRFLAPPPSSCNACPHLAGWGELAYTLSCASLSFIYADAKLRPLSCLSAFSSYLALTSQWFRFFPQNSITKEIRKVSKKEILLLDLVLPKVWDLLIGFWSLLPSNFLEIGM